MDEVSYWYCRICGYHLYRAAIEQSITVGLVAKDGAGYKCLCSHRKMYTVPFIKTDSEKLEL